MSRPTDEELIAFVDGELADAERRRIEAAIAHDPELERLVERHSGLRQRVAGAYAGVLEERPPDRFAALIAGAEADTVVRPARWARRPVLTWAAMAASLAFGAVLGLGVSRLNAPPIVQDDSGLEARGVLTAALERNAAADAGPVQIGLTFRSRGRAFCRTFRLSEAELAGVACREGDGWRVRMLADAPPQPAGEYRAAGATTPPLVLEAVGAIIEGEPLDAQQEAAARARGWRD